MKLLANISENTDGFLTFASTICYDFLQKSLAQDILFFQKFIQEWELPLKQE
jgi:hypothetical protein